jgi:hypothetical protein
MLYTVLMAAIGYICNSFDFNGLGEFRQAGMDAALD